MSDNDQFSSWLKYRNYLRCLANQALPRHGLNALDASDLAQNVITVAYEKRAQFRGETSRERMAWLRRMLRNRVIDEWRRVHGRKPDQKREKLIATQFEDSSVRLESWVSDHGIGPGDQAQLDEQLIQLADQLAQLPENQRQVVELHYLQDMTFSEVAEELAMSRNQVAGLVWRALRRLRSSFSDSTNQPKP